MKELGAKERGNGTYIYDVPSFLIERNGLRYKGTWERHIYIGGSRGGKRRQSPGGSQPLFSTTSRPNHQGVIPPTHAGNVKPFSRGMPMGVGGHRISGTLEGVDRPIALVRPQVLKPFSGAIHG